MNVLNHLYHCEEKFGVSVPQKDFIDILHFVFILFNNGDVGLHIEQQKNGHVWMSLLDTAAQFKWAYLTDSHHRNNQIERAVFQYFQRLSACGNTCDARCGAKVELAIFTEYLLGKPTVLFKDIGIVKGGHQQYLFDVILHQIVKVVLAKLKFIIVIIEFR